MSDSCTAKSACQGLAYNTFTGDLSGSTNVGNIRDSCTAEYACYNLAYYGEVGDICNSCRNSTCCEDLCKENDDTKLPSGSTCDPATDLLNFCNPSNATMVNSCKASKSGKYAKSGKHAKSGKSSKPF